MRILVTTHHLHDFAGSEWFTYHLVGQLLCLGHEVRVYTALRGTFAERMVAEGMIVSERMEDFADEHFDVIHAQHNTTALLARAFFPEVPIIFMSHGIFPDLEQPPSLDIGIAHYGVVQEGQAQHLRETYGIAEADVSVVRNMVDTTRFVARKPVSKKLRSVLVVSNHFPPETQSLLARVC